MADSQDCFNEGQLRSLLDGTMASRRIGRCGRSFGGMRVVSAELGPPCRARRHNRQPGRGARQCTGAVRSPSTKSWQG